MENVEIPLVELQLLVLSFLPKQRCTLANIARSLGYNPRTLQRHLLASGIVFEEYLDSIRRVQAENLLSHTDLDFDRISYLLGYCRKTSFYRAHKRWFGISPLEHRSFLCNS